MHYRCMCDGVADGDMPVANPRLAERRLWAAFGRGELVDLRADDPDANDPARGDSWDESRWVRAEVVAALLLGAVKPTVGCVSVVRLAGAVVEGTVDVRQGTIGYAAELTGCRFTDGLLLTETRARTVDLSGSVLKTLDATAAEIGGELVLNRCRATAISLSMAHVTGNLWLNGAYLFGADAFLGDQLTVDGSVICGERFRAEGEVRLPGAHIGGQLSLTGAHLTNPGARALSADGLTVGAGIFCDMGFRARGEVRLPRAHITGPLSLSGGHLINRGDRALNANGLTVDGNMLCEDRFRARGRGPALEGAHRRAAVTDRRRAHQPRLSSAFR